MGLVLRVCRAMAEELDADAYVHVPYRSSKLTFALKVLRGFRDYDSRAAGPLPSSAHV